MTFITKSNIKILSLCALCIQLSLISLNLNWVASILILLASIITLYALFYRATVVLVNDDGICKGKRRGFKKMEVADSIALQNFASLELHQRHDLFYEIRAVDNNQNYIVITKDANRNPAKKKKKSIEEELCKYLDK